jgi:DNA-binding LacI/PurR family transcriptional regulator
VSQQRPTLADVAAAAGVSVSTASLAFSGAGPIAAATRERVLETAKEIGYTGPNPLGRQLRRGRSGIVGVVVGDALRRSFRDPVSVQVLDGITSELGPLGLGVLLIPGPLDVDEPEVNPLIQTAAMDVAIMLWGGTLNEVVLDALRRRGIPIVLVEGRRQPGLSVVGIADQQGVAEVTEHLVRLGHTRIAAVTLPFGADRASGFVDAERLAHVQWDLTRRRLAGIRDAGVEPMAIYETAASLVEHGTEAGRALLTLPDRPTAIVCHSDLLAGGVVLAARELGLRVPEDVSVAGFDGLDLPWLLPDVLTTVAQPLAEKGKAAGREAARLLVEGEEPASVELPVSLVVGTTTGPPPA